MVKVKDKRAGKRTVKQRKAVLKQKATNTLEGCVDLFMNVKQANNLKDRTLRDYMIHLNYLKDWLDESYGELPINQIDITILREYIIWCSKEKAYNGGHPFKENAYKGKLLCYRSKGQVI